MKAKILIVEDESIEAMNFQQSLESLGYEVVGISQTGEDAIVKAGELRPDLVLMDVVLMGELDGIEAAAQIKENFNIPVVYLTAHPEESTINRAMLTSPYGYLIKPVNKTDLKNNIKLALNKHQMEVVLYDSEEKYRNLFENANDTIMIRNQDGVILDANPAACEMFGYTYEELVGKSHKKLISPRCMHILPDIKRKIENQGYYKYEIIFLDADGTEINAEANCRRTKFVNQDDVLCIARDITQRKLVEKELERRKTYYWAIFEHTGTATLILDEDNTISMANRECEKLIGYSIDDIVGRKKWTDFVAKEDLEKMKYYHQKRSENLNSIPKNYDFRLITKNGQIKNIKLDVELIPGTKKSVASLRDITERIKATEILHKESSKLKSILDSMLDGVYIVNKDYEIDYVNPSIVKEFGLVKGQKCYEYINDLDDICPWCKNDEVFNGKTVQWEATHKKTGKIYELFDIPLKNPDDTISKLEILHDITHHKRIEDALIESEKKYRELVDYSMVAVYRTNLDGEILFANHAMARMFDFESIEDLEAISIIELYRNIEDRNRLISTLKKDKFVSQFEVEAVSKSGRIFNALLSAHLSDDKISGMIMDITDLRKAEKVIKKSLEEKENLLKDTSPGEK
jgi:PAS domain S-box-containing protein